MIHILKKEFSSFFNSLIAYVVMAIFLTTMGLLVWVFPETSVLEYGYADLNSLFSFGPYVFIFLVPAITMRSFAEEKKSGTMELLLTKPLSDWDIILGKFFACWALVVFALIPTVIYYFSIVRLGNPVGNVDTAGVIGSYVGFALLGGVFCAIGICSSVITNNQIVAFVIGAFLCFLVLLGFESISNVAMWSSQALTIKQLGLVYHYDALSKGVIDSRDVCYFFSIVILVLSITKIILGSRKW
jgi:ABC-2 type transport system permease protein